jgi:hypothetical protein
MTCIGEPISWLRLERHALAADPTVAEHVAACAACRHCLDEIRGDLVALPMLVVPERRLRWWRFAIPALAAAAIAIVVLRPRPEPQHHGELLAGVKGVGDVVVELVRERAGAIREDATTFSPGDRWKLVVTCASATGAWLDVAVTEAGARDADHPLAPTHVACGNAVPVPGAFELTGTKPNNICVRVRAEREEIGERACVTVTRETP